MHQVRNIVCEKCVLFGQTGDEFSIKFLNQVDTLLLLCVQNLKIQLYIVKCISSYSPRHRNIKDRKEKNER